MHSDDVNKFESKLREAYSLHSNHVTPGVYEDLRAYDSYYLANYGALLSLPSNTPILEIGSGSGSLLTFLRDLGFTNLTGVEVSESEASRCRDLGLNVYTEDAFEFLSRADKSPKVIIMKAVLEHFPRDEGLKLLKIISEKLNGSDGILLVDVPNMDWIFASHERYMDLTHHTGFTESSLQQALRMFFDDVQVRPSLTPKGVTLKQKMLYRMVRPFVMSLIRRFLFLWADGAETVSFESRNLIGVGQKK